MPLEEIDPEAALAIWRTNVLGAILCAQAALGDLEASRGAIVNIASTAGLRGYAGGSPKKLHAEDIAHAVCGALAMHDRGFIPELTVFATNPWPAP
jgi:3-oxoacyl-[acyl-carrier protein] reductase